MAEKISQDDFYNIQLTLPVDVFIKIIKYAIPKDFSKSTIATYYRMCFARLNKEDFIKDHIYDMDRKSRSRDISNTEVIYTLLLVFIYNSKAYSDKLQKVLSSYYVELTNYASEFIPNYDVRCNFYDFAKEFGMSLREGRTLNVNSTHRDINTQLDELTKYLSDKMKELCVSAVKSYEDKIKELERENKSFRDNKVKIEAEKASMKCDIQKMNARCRSLESQVAKLQSEPKKKEDKELDITGAYCEIAVRYMNANRNKSQSAREKKKDVLNDIMNQLKLNPSEEIRKRINDFDDVQRPPRLKLEINGDVKTLSVDGDLNVEKGDVNIDEYNEK